MTKSAWLTLVLALAACDSGAHDISGAGTTHVDTIGGVVHVTQSGVGAWATGTPWRADTARAVEIGMLDGPDPYVFGQITGVVVGKDGRIYVADGQAEEVRIFSPDGKFLARFGREGGGPGEFRSISGLGRGPEDAIAALDPRQEQVSVFGPEGKFQRAFDLDRVVAILQAGSPVRFDSAGRYYDLTHLMNGLYVDTVGVVRYDTTGMAMDTTVVTVEEPPYVPVTRGKALIASMKVPFAPHASSAVGPDGRIYATHGNEYYIAELNASGDTVRTVERWVQSVPVSAGDRDSAREALVTRYTKMAGAAPRDVPAIPDHWPAIEALQVDETGHLWVLRGTADPSVMAWDVLDSDGRYLGTVTFPTMHVMHIGENTIAGMVRDEMDVPRVRVIPIRRE